MQKDSEFHEHLERRLLQLTGVTLKFLAICLQFDNQDNRGYPEANATELASAELVRRKL
jgi:hypothetical protein